MSVFMHYKLDFNQLEVKIQDALEMLHMADDSSDPVYDEVEQVFGELPQICNISGNVVIYDHVEVMLKEGKIRSDVFEIEPRRRICTYMRGIEKMAAFICTAGEKFTSLTRQLNDNGDYLGGFIVNTFGSIVVEKAMDYIQEQLQVDMQQAGLEITNRYSPGYCLWPLSGQRELFDLFPENQSGISLTESLLMIPMKSVSGIIGIGANVKKSRYKCDICNDLTCVYRNIRQRN